MPYTVARPSPVPRPTALVVKKGSKMCGRASSGIPMPVSVSMSETVKVTSVGRPYRILVQAGISDRGIGGQTEECQCQGVQRG